MKDLKDAQDQYVVECAAELFMQHGIDGVKMVDIARAAGVGVATVYRHFSTKVHVASLAAELLWEKFNERLHELVESDWFLQLNGLGRLLQLLQGAVVVKMVRFDVCDYDSVWVEEEERAI